MVEDAWTSTAARGSVFVVGGLQHIRMPESLVTR